MKIILLRKINPYFESSASGNRFSSIIDGLISEGVHVVLIVTGGYNSIEEFKLKGIKEHNKQIKIKYTVFAFYHTVWFRRLNLYLLSGLLSLISSCRLKQLLKDKCDFLWLTKDTFVLNFFNKYHSLFTNKTIIELNEFNDVYKTDELLTNSLQKNQTIKEDKVFIEVINKIDIFVIMTQTLISHYHKLTTNENALFFHFPMTVNMKRFDEKKETSKYKKPYIAFTGTHSNRKDGVDVLIKAFAKLSDSYPDYHLYLAGFYHPDVIQQKEMIKKYQLQDRIIYLGVLDKEQIPELIQNADLLVLSRPDSHQAQGGFPTKLGEYLATGNPVCVTKVGEIPMYLQDNVSAFLSSPGNVDSFADSMERALSNIENARKVGQCGKEVANECFNAEVQAKRLINFLENV